MSLIKDLSKEKKQVDIQIKKITKERLNDRTSESWANLRELKKKKLAVKDKINFLPLYFDASNPSSNLGWDDSERKSLKERADFDGVIALAFKHQ